VRWLERSLSIFRRRSAFFDDLRAKITVFGLMDGVYALINGVCESTDADFHLINGVCWEEFAKSHGNYGVFQGELGESQVLFGVSRVEISDF
jgi:hypothetical protein